jgi:hypothetical protein
MAKHVFKNKAMVPVSAKVFNFTIWIMIPLMVDSQQSTVVINLNIHWRPKVNGQRSMAAVSYV